MNRHFDDAWYHTKRAGVNVRMGVEMELDSVRNRAERLLGREPVPEPKRLDEVREDVMRVERRAETTARRTAEKARTRMRPQ